MDVMDVMDVLVELCSLSGPPGFEEPVAKHVCSLMEPYMDETWIDVMGNAIGVRRCGKEGARKLLFDAHIDEIGLIITGCEEGYLRFAPLGGLDARVASTAGIQVLTDPPHFGVVCALPPHVLKQEDTEKFVKFEDMYIDVGLTQEVAEKAIPLGTPAVPVSSIRHFGSNYVCGKALDDRAGFVAILRSLELLQSEKLEVDLYVMASVQEEVGTRGAAPGVYAIAPDYCVVIDVGHAKTPDSKPTDTLAQLGSGVLIARGPNMNQEFTKTVVELAEKHEIKHMIEVIPTGMSGTNARAIQVSREGVSTALFGIPLKYMHCTHEVASLEDIECTAQLLSETAKSLVAK